MYAVNSNYYEKYKIISKRETVFKKQNTLILEIESELTKCKCPKCGEISNEYSVTYYRDIEDVPYNFMSIWLHIYVHKFKCNNPNCPKKYFDEVLPFARKHKVKTDNYIRFILSLSIFMSSTATSLILSLLGSTVSADAIDLIVHNIEIKDDKDIDGIGVDDVSHRKGQTYLTAIYDLKDHHLIALLDGRDAEEFEKWLKEHPKVKTIARDRASAYATAINKVLPECTQIADRFHLFKNLIEYLKEIFYKEVPEKIFIKDGQILDKGVKKVPSEIANIDLKKLEEMDYDNSLPTDENGNIIEFDNRRRDFDSKQYVEQAERRVQKKIMIKELRERLKNSTCHETKEIAKEFNISIFSLRKYKKMTEDEVENIDKIKVYKKSSSMMDDSSNIIYKMLKDNIPQEYIFAYVKQKGCQASDRYLLDYINLVAKNNNFPYKEKRNYIKLAYPKDVTVITRYELLKYLLTLDDSKRKNKDIENNIKIIVKKYPIVKDVQMIFKDFHDTIFSNDEEMLDMFIEVYKNKINAFCNGLEKDIAAIKNAISSEISSGFVEGNNNKFKLIKRILYGKSNLVNLFKKCYLSFAVTLDDFDISLLIEDVLNPHKKDKLI